MITVEGHLVGTKQYKNNYKQLICDCGWEGPTGDLSRLDERLGALEHIVEVLADRLATTSRVAQEANNWASMMRPIGPGLSNISSKEPSLPWEKGV